jgi:hypothetical protein
VGAGVLITVLIRAVREIKVDEFIHLLPNFFSGKRRVVC